MRMCLNLQAIADGMAWLTNSNAATALGMQAVCVCVVTRQVLALL
jgi:hypothetical protein